jgi:hypothetical protein
LVDNVNCIEQIQSFVSKSNSPTVEQIATPRNNNINCIEQIESPVSKTDSSTIEQIALEFDEVINNFFNFRSRKKMFLKIATVFNFF